MTLARKIYVHPSHDGLNKTTILYFNGGINEWDVRYSHGIRQTIFAMFKNQSGFKLVDRVANDRSGEISQVEVFLELAQSTFCLAVTGGGFGVRLKQSIQMGCIPVICADDVQMEFEDVLPYHDFAIRLPYHALYRMPFILDKFMQEPDRVKAMQERVQCVARYFSYRKPFGRALETLMCSLRRKVYGWNNIFPLMDWETCTLYCSTLASLSSKEWGNNERFSLSDPVQQLKLMPGRRG